MPFPAVIAAVVPYEEDEVTRVHQDQVNETVYDEVKGWTVGDEQA